MYKPYITFMFQHDDIDKVLLT